MRVIAIAIHHIHHCLCRTENCVTSFCSRDWRLTLDTVYLISCNTCGDKYIGETGRSFCIHNSERLPLGMHKLQMHYGEKDFDVEVATLRQDSEKSIRKILEAFLINAKKREMNCGEECFEIIHELPLYSKNIFHVRS